ncbi:hypothetical protein RNJ44_02921 [Nakaseomyces bracarensis]|uniref:HMG box domain-containing protein n=1 Tax=Nakaseomyces bracarensis TaxID=273131 RepID=A0ABR4P0M1_9SACH
MQNVSLPPISQLLATLPLQETPLDAPSSPSSVASSHSCLSTASLSSLSASPSMHSSQKFFDSRSYTTAAPLLQLQKNFSAEDYREIHRRSSTASSSSTSSVLSHTQSPVSSVATSTSTPVAVSVPVASAHPKTQAVTKNSTRHIPRPRNAFILFRQHMHRQLFPKLTKDKQNCSDNTSSFKTNSECSREIGQKWRNLDPEEKKYWNELARKEKEWHRMKYPNYKYTPTKKAAVST